MDDGDFNNESLFCYALCLVFHSHPYNRQLLLYLEDVVEISLPTEKLHLRYIYEDTLTTKH